MSHYRPQTQSTLVNLGKRPNWNLTPTAHRVKERSLAGSRNAGRRIIQKGKLLPCSRVSLTYLNAKSPLARRRAHSLSRNDLPHKLSQAKPIHPSRSQNEGGRLSRLQLPQPRVDVAAQRVDVEIRPQGHQLRLPAKTAGTHPCSWWQGLDTGETSRKKSIQRIFALG